MNYTSCFWNLTETQVLSISLTWVLSITLTQSPAQAAPPPPTNHGRRRRLLMVGAAIDNLSARRRCHVVVLNCCFPFFMFCMIFLKKLPWCEIEVYTFLARQFVPMSGLQNSILEKPIVIGFYS